jgi:hypothetical protein
MVTLSVAVDHEYEWWRPLVSALVNLPVIVWQAVLTGVSGPLAIVGALVVLATGRLPEPFARFHVHALEVRARAYSALFALAKRPAAALEVRIEQPPTRWEAITRPVAAIVHLLVLVPIALCLDALLPLWLLVAAVNRGWPPPMLRGLVAAERWIVHLVLWVTMVTNDRPAFGLAANEAPATA